MTPTREQMDNVRAQAERLEAMRFTDHDGVIVPVFQGEPPKDALSWGDLTTGQKEAALAIQLNWEGFGPEEELAVIENIAAGKEPAEWMEGLTTEQWSDREYSENWAEPTNPEIERVVSGLEASWPADIERQRDDTPVEPESMPESSFEELDPVFRSWRDDASQRPLAEKGVDYSDRPYGEKGDYDRALREAAEQSRYRANDPDRGRDR
jgi:hypothetical protein